MTKEEAKAIDGVMKYDEIADLYNPELSDPVKATYRGGHITMAKLKRYFNAWFSMFLRHPGVYIEATLHNSYGYYYPFHNCTAQSSYRFYTVNEPLIEESDYHQIFSAEIKESAETLCRSVESDSRSCADLQCGNLHMDRDSAPWISDLQEAMERNTGIGCPGAECGNLYSFSGKRSSALCVSVDGVYASCDILGTGLCREGYRRKKNRRKMKSLNFFYGKYIVR